FRGLGGTCGAFHGRGARPTRGAHVGAPRPSLRFGRATRVLSARRLHRLSTRGGKVMLVAVGILIKILVVVGITQGAVAYMILLERKVAAYAQDRIGPNRAGAEFGLPFGLLQ